MEFSSVEKAVLFSKQFYLDIIFDIGFPVDLIGFIPFPLLLSACPDTVSDLIFPVRYLFKRTE